MGGLFLRLRTWWETADRTQKAVTLFGGVFLGILLLGTFYFASKPKLQPAFAQLSFADMGKVEEEAKKLGYPVEISENGTVCLPADKIAEVKARLAIDGFVPASGGATDSMGTSSPFEPKDLQLERQRLRLEAEITDSIKFIEGVGAARVKIAPSSNSPFADEKQSATASVTILEKPGMSLSSEGVKAIANLVAFSTPGLDTSHVTIANQQGRLLWDGTSQNGVEGQADKKLAAENAEAKRREHELQNMLDQAFGPNTTIARVSVVLDFDRKETKETTPTVVDTPDEEKLSETMDSAGKGPLSPQFSGQKGQKPGNGPAIADTTAGNSSNYNNEHSTKVFPKGSKETYDQPSTGSVTGMTVTVLADSANFADQQDALQKAVDGYIGPKLDDKANYRSTVELVKFDTTAADAAKKTAAAGAMGDKIQQIVSMLPIAALLLVGFMVVKAISKAAKDQTVLVQALPDGRMIPISSPISLPSSSGGSAEIVAAQDQNGLPALKKSKPEIGEIPDNVNVPLEQIKKMSVERPEAVAMLIKSWLLEDRR